MPEQLNAVIMDMIDGIRDKYRRDWGTAGQRLHHGHGPVLLTDHCGDVERSTASGLDKVVGKYIHQVYKHSVGTRIFNVLLSNPHNEDMYIDTPCSKNQVHMTMNNISGLNFHIRCHTNHSGGQRGGGTW